MPLPFLTRPIQRLRADGRLDAPGPQELALGAPTLLLARELCRFELFRAPAGLPRRAALSAARVHAQTRAPFAQPGFAVARRGGDFGLWWWDGERVDRLLAAQPLPARLRLRPEAAGEAPGDASAEWRILRDDTGWEAQRWVDGFLAASQWRARPFDAEAWRSVIRAAGGDASVPPPPARPPVYVARSPYAARFVESADAAAWAPAAAGLALTASLALTAFFAGQGLSLARRDGALRREIATREASPVLSRRPALAARARGFAELSRVVDRPSPLERLAEVQGILARFGLRPSGFDARPGEIVVTVAGSAAVGVDLLVEELQASPSFSDVRPALDRETRQLTLRIRTTS